MPTVTGTSGADNLSASDESGGQLNEVYGLDGNDTITGRPRAFEGFRYLLDGGAGDDIIRILPNHPSTTATATIFGGSGNDIIDTQESRNTIDAGSGDDRIYVDVADPGGDNQQPFLQNMTLGDGSDYVFLRRINDLTTNSIFITDFQAGVGGDAVDLVNVLSILQNYTGASPFATGHLRLVQQGADTIIRLDLDGPGATGTAVQNLITLRNVQASDMTSANFAGFSIDGSNVPGLTLNGGSGADALVGTHADDTVLGFDGSDTLSGGFGDDNLVGGAGADRLDGGFGTDSLLGGDDNDVLIDDMAGNDHLDGGAGDDTLTIGRSFAREPGTLLLEGGAGNDTLTYSATRGVGQSNLRNSDTVTMRGGDGNDTFVLDGGGTFILEMGSGSDTIQRLGGGIDAWSVTVADFTSGVGGDVIAGFPGTAVQMGADTLIGGILLRNVIAGFLDPFNTGGFQLVTIDGTTSNDTLIGNLSSNNLNGLGGDDFMDGRGGGDNLTGGNGNDTYVVYATNDRVFENAGGGFDTVYAGGDYTLTAGNDVEVLSAREWGSTTALQLTGNGIANTLYGNAGANILDGGGGADVLIGFGGNDVYVVDNSGDRVFEAAGEGVDTVFTEVNFFLGAASQVEVLSTRDWGTITALQLAGGDIANTLFGNAGANFLDGGGGADQLYGFGGDDIYVVDNAGDRIFEDAGGGNDVIYTEVDYRLEAGSYVERLAARDSSGTTNLNLIGNVQANTLYANGGNNYLDGGGGVDVLYGFGGNDTYVVDNTGDQVIEAAGEGTDIIFSEISYTLATGSAVETLSTRDWGGTADLNLTGNEVANTLFGNAGANLLDGGGGADQLYGFGGGDIYVVDNARDAVYESVGDGSDIVFTTTTWRLTAGSEIELLSTRDWSSTTAIDLYGNERANELAGNAGANVLDGGAGADILNGFGGADSFVFSTALGGGNIDWIIDFQHAVDRIVLDGAVFQGLTSVTASNFVVGTAAQDAEDRVIFDTSTGFLYFDADGAGGQAAVQFAKLSANSGLNWDDFISRPSSAPAAPQVLPALAGDKTVGVPEVLPAGDEGFVFTGKFDEPPPVMPALWGDFDASLSSTREMELARELLMTWARENPLHLRVGDGLILADDWSGFALPSRDNVWA